MNSKRPLVPAWLNKLDRRLLLNRPNVWTSRIHLVLYYVLLFNLLILGIGFAFPSDPRLSGSIGSLTTLVAVVCFLGLIIWIIYLLRFNVFKRFGKESKFEGLKNFLLYFLAVGSFVATPFVPSLIETTKAHLTYDYDEIATDINKINLNVAQLNRDSLSLSWERSTKTLDSSKARYAETVYSAEGGPIEYFADSTMFFETVLNNDSLKKLNDSSYIIYECPDYVFARTWGLETNTSVKVLNSVDVYRQVLENYKPPANRQEIVEALNRLLKKYETYPLYESGKIYHGEVESYMSKIRTRYNLDHINDNLGNIVDKMDRWDERSRGFFLMIFYYTTLIITLLLFSFRHISTRTFFLTLLSAVLISILTGLLFSGIFVSSAIFPLALLLVYYFLFALFAFAIRLSTVKTAANGIAINLFLYLTPFIPLVITGLIYTIIRENNFNVTTEQFERYKELTKHEEMHMNLAQVAGFVLLVIMVEPVFKKLYRKRFSLPED